MDISSTRMHFLWVNVTFYDAVNMIHDVIITVKFMSVILRNHKKILMPNINGAANQWFLK